MPRDYQAVTLEQTLFGFKQVLQEHLALDVDVNSYQDSLLMGVVYEFRAAIWTHKLPPETKTATTQLTIPTWNSAWQLWKANHAESKLFGWIARRWPPQKRGSETHKATASFRLDKSTLFPEYHYPTNMGTGYHQVVVGDTVWKWD